MIMALIDDDIDDDDDAAHDLATPLLLATTSESMFRHPATATSTSSVSSSSGYIAACVFEQSDFRQAATDEHSTQAKRKLITAVALCFVFMIAELIGGYRAGSLAIMTDAAHLLSDCVSFIVALLAIWLANKPADGRMSFGYRRAEVVGAVLSVIGIWLLTAILLFAATGRLLSGNYEIDANTMMAMAGIGVAINIVMGMVLHGSLNFFGHNHSHSGGGHSHSGHSHLEHSHSGHSHSGHSYSGHSHQLCDGERQAIVANGGHHHKLSNGNVRPPVADVAPNINVRAAIIHVIGDLIQSVGVFIAAVIIKFYPDAKMADPICTYIFSVIVVLTTYRIMRDAARVLLDAVPPDLPLAQLEAELQHIGGVLDVHHLNVWCVTVASTIMSAHLIVDPSLKDTDAVLQQATQVCKLFGIEHTTIQIEKRTEADVVASQADALIEHILDVGCTVNDII